jgi:hypothetical protein
MKKKLVLALGACMLIATSYAQPFKQAGGEKNLQVLFTPLGNNPISISGISFRKFNATGTAAWRLNLFIGMSSNTDITHQAGDSLDNNGNVAYPTFETSGVITTTHGAAPETDRQTKATTFSIRPGYEKHFAGTDRLSPYIGAEIMFSKTSTKVTEGQIYDNTPVFTVYDSSTVVKVNAPWTVATLESKNHRDNGASTTFGINLIAGFDFYFAKNLSLGAEMGFGWSTTSYPDYESEYVKHTVTDARTDANPPTTIFGHDTYTTTDVVTSNPAAKQGKSSNLSPNVVGQIKLGWLF